MAGISSNFENAGREDKCQITATVSSVELCLKRSLTVENSYTFSIFLILVLVLTR